MDPDRRVRLWRRVVERAQDLPVTVEHVCAAMVSQAAVDGAAVVLVVEASPHELVHATDPVASELAELAQTLGEGPSVDGLAGDLTLVADLAEPGSASRWPLFAPAALSLGARALFALPLHVGGIRLGVIDLHRARPGPLSAAQLHDALTLADTACALLLDAADADHGQPGGGLAIEAAAPQHAEVHQATGMMIIQLEVSAAVALVRLRAYAYAHDRRLREVAADVVARRLRFHPDDPTDVG